MQVTEMDALCNRIAKEKADIAELEEQVEMKKAGIKDIQRRVEEYFIETGRTEPYKSPFGTLYLFTDLQVKQPKGEQLKAVFDHFVKLFGEDIAWQKMSIHNATLKTELKEYTTALEERGGDPILEPFPGVEPPSVVKTLRFRKGNK